MYITWCNFKIGCCFSTEYGHKMETVFLLKFGKNYGTFPSLNAKLMEKIKRSEKRYLLKEKKSSFMSLWGKNRLFIFVNKKYLYMFSLPCKIFGLNNVSICI